MIIFIFVYIFYNPPFPQKDLMCLQQKAYIK